MVSEVYNCDCLEYMRSLPDSSFSLAIADPPYWTPEEQSGRIRVSGNRQSTLGLGRLDPAFFYELRRVSASQIIWGANNYGFAFKGYIVWNKTNIPEKFTLSKCELASVSADLSKTSKLVSLPSTHTGLKRFHPTQKPIELYAWILTNYAKRGGAYLTR